MKPEKRSAGSDIWDAIFNPKRYIKLKNLTDKPIKVAVVYLDGITNQWKSRCWKTLGSGVESTDKSSFSYNRAWYYYAESVDGDKIWSGAGYDYPESLVRSCGGRSLKMKKKWATWPYGDLSFDFTGALADSPQAPPPTPPPTPEAVSDCFDSNGMFTLLLCY